MLRTVCSMHGRPRTGSMGLGLVLVKGRNLVPSPPAMITACLTFPLMSSLHHLDDIVVLPGPDGLCHGAALRPQYVNHWP